MISYTLKIYSELCSKEWAEKWDGNWKRIEGMQKTLGHINIRSISRE